mgnify:CR=1 FL=1
MLPVLYDRPTDLIYYLPRSVEEAADLVAGLRADLLLRGWNRWFVCPESPREPPNFFTREEIVKNARRGYTYEHLKKAVRAMHERGVKYCGGVGVQWLNARERDPVTKKVYERSETWAMALDPGKWDIPYPKIKFQERMARRLGHIAPDEPYNPAEVRAYFPDLTNEDYQKLFLNIVRKQVECGVDAVFVDALYVQAIELARLAGKKHQAVQETWEAIYNIVSEIKRMGVEVISWIGYLLFPEFSPPPLDYGAATPLAEEIKNKKLNSKRWDEISKRVAHPSLVYLDYGLPKLPIWYFSQEYTLEEQRRFLPVLDKFFTHRGLTFVPTLHCIIAETGIKRLAWGKFPLYDATAPEFYAYDVLEKIALEKVGGKEKKEVSLLQVVAPRLAMKTLTPRLDCLQSPERRDFSKFLGCLTPRLSALSELLKEKITSTP